MSSWKMVVLRSVFLYSSHSTMVLVSLTLFFSLSIIPCSDKWPWRRWKTPMWMKVSLFLASQPFCLALKASYALMVPALFVSLKRQRRTVIEGQETYGYVSKQVNSVTVCVSKWSYVCCCPSDPSRQQWSDPGWESADWHHVFESIRGDSGPQHRKRTAVQLQPVLSGHQQGDVLID